MSLCRNTINFFRIAWFGFKAHQVSLSVLSMPAQPHREITLGRAERLYAIDRLLRERGSLSLEEFMSALEVSRATFRRDLDYLRDRLHAPIVWDAADRKYRLNGGAGDQRIHALPGLWFNESELHALLAMQALLEKIEPGLLEPHLAPLRQKLTDLLGKGWIDPRVIGQRIRINAVTRRSGRTAHFGVVSAGLLSRKQLQITHYNRETGEVLARLVSPQRLVYYRDNWYLEAWCHLREDLRSFSVDALREASILAVPAREVDPQRLTERFDSGYGIFSGRHRHWAVLRFSAYRSRWVAAEMWHPEQQGCFDDQGRYELKVPYNDLRELSGEVLRYGGDCEVMAPEALRNAVAEAASKMARIYR
jgi:predicted DNA-binding transcriptional regulator YafY